MRKIAHIIDLKQDYYLDFDGQQMKVLSLYIDEYGTESGALIMYPDGVLMSCDSDIFDDMSESDDGSTNRVYMSKADMRSSKLNKLLDEQ